jgi:lysophospholipase L1-like esterase
VRRDEFIWPSIEQESTFVDDNDPITHPLHDIEDVGTVDDGFAFARQCLDQRLETHRGVCIQSVERFVKENNWRVMQQRRRDHDFPPHTFGICPQELVSERGKTEIEKADELLDSNKRSLLRNFVKSSHHFEVLESRERLKHRTRFGNKADVPFYIDHLLSKIKTGNGCCPAGGLEHSCQHFQCGGFTSTIWPKEPDNLSRGNVQGERVDSDLRPKIFCELLERNHVHPRYLASFRRCPLVIRWFGLCAVLENTSLAVHAGPMFRSLAILVVSVCFVSPGAFNAFAELTNTVAGRNSNSNALPAVVVCLGDSITRSGYPAELEKILKVRVANAGVNGNTSRQGLARLQRDVLSLKPKIVVLFFGANDSRLDAPKKQVALDEYTANLSKIVDECQRIGAKVLLGTMPPIIAEPYFGRHPKENYDAVGGFEKHLEKYRNAAHQVGREKKVEVLDLGKELQKYPNWVTPDGVHPTPEGNEIIAKLVAEKLKPMFEGRSSK